MLEAASRNTIDFGADLHLAPTLAITRLATLPFLCANDLTVLGRCAVSRRAVMAGFELVHEGEPTDSLYFVEEGWACRFMTTRTGRRQITMVLVRGDVCDLDALLFKQLDYGVRMLTAGTILVVPRDQVIALVAGSPAIAEGLAWLGMIENAILSRHMLCLGRMSSKERLAHLLCELAVRLGVGGADGEIRFGLPLTQEHLADVLGLTPVHVNRTLQRLRTEGLLSSTHRTIAICDVAAFRRMAEFRPGYLHGAEPLGDRTGRGATTISLNA